MFYINLIDMHSYVCFIQCTQLVTVYLQIKVCNTK